MDNNLQGAEQSKEIDLQSSILPVALPVSSIDDYVISAIVEISLLLENHDHMTEIACRSTLSMQREYRERYNQIYEVQGDWVRKELSLNQ